MVGLGDTENGLKHSGDTMQSSAFLIGDSMENGLGVKGLVGKNDLGTVGHDGKHAQNQSEAMKEWRGTAQNIEGGQIHAVTDESGIVDEVTAER